MPTGIQCRHHHVATTYITIKTDWCGSLRRLIIEECGSLVQMQDGFAATLLKETAIVTGRMAIGL